LFVKRRIFLINLQVIIRIMLFLALIVNDKLTIKFIAIVEKNIAKVTIELSLL